MTHAPAKYKIEVHFGKGRTHAGPNASAITIFESGKRLNGDGDELVYFCSERDKGLALNSVGVADRPVERGQHGCGKIIPCENIRGGVAICNCEKRLMIASENLTSTLLVNLTTDRLASLVEDLFHRVSDNADVYVKYHPQDIRAHALSQGNELNDARNKRALVIYPLANIIKDITNGSTLQSRLKALFTA
ncbi:MAG: hypothetical protein ACO32I_04930 [Candidatus Limnocylindrus sp.]|jgi:hypothetical protein